jgi:hypothetical protein
MLLGGCPILFHECDARQSQLEKCTKLIPGQISLETPPFISVSVEDQNAWRPNCVKAVKISRTLLYMDPERNKVFFDVRRQTGVFV